MENLLKQILENQIIIMEQLWRTTHYPHIQDEMQKAIKKSSQLINKKGA